ncbi:MAG: hypothetical protein IID46_05615 [Planctomycetes bacterium]|nr:hypothetical protein [Planctomycetota bacterium]
MIRRHLVFHLKRVEKRIRRYRLLRNTAICWGLSAGVIFGIVLLMSLTKSSQTFAAWWVVAGSVFAVAALVVWNRIRNISSKAVAHAIERKYPDLNERLLTAVEQQTDPENELSYLREQLVSEVLVHHRRNNWLMTVPASRMLKASLLNLAGLALFLVASVVLYRFEIPTDESRILTGSATTIDAGLEYGISVEPGDQSLERGTGQVFIARFSEKLPADVTLVLTEQGAETRRIPLFKSLDDPLFGGQVSSIRFDASYFIEYDDLRTRDYRITVFDFPALLRADATIEFPKYADLPDTVIPDARSISFVEGSTVTIACFLNKPVTSARLLSDENKPLELKFHNVQNNEYRIALTPKQSGRYRLELVDDQGRHNKYPPEFDLSVLPNQRPNLKLAFPAKDVRVSPLEEMALEGTVWDDFGLKQFGVIYTLAGRQPVTVVLGKDVSGKKTEQIIHQVSFEDLSAEPDELVSYYLFAEDFGPDGKLRKTFSDMFFAEVRHFEEIFREGRQPPGGQSKKQQKGGQSQQADQLAQLQKQIINATWNVYRRESATELSRAFSEDVGLIEESQNKAIDMVREIDKKLKNPKSKALVKIVADHMKQAAESLGKAVGDTNIEPLSPALTFEQGAYKALLKLRATEHQVSRSQQSGGGGGGGGGFGGGGGGGGGIGRRGN